MQRLCTTVTAVCRAPNSFIILLTITVFLYLNLTEFSGSTVINETNGVYTFTVTFSIFIYRIE